MSSPIKYNLNGTVICISRVSQNAVNCGYYYGNWKDGPGAYEIGAYSITKKYELYAFNHIDYFEIIDRSTRRENERYDFEEYFGYVYPETIKKTESDDSSKPELNCKIINGFNQNNTINDLNWRNIFRDLKNEGYYERHKVNREWLRTKIDESDVLIKNIRDTNNIIDAQNCHDFNIYQ